MNQLDDIITYRKHGLIWKRDGADWLLLAGRRRMGRVVPDSEYSGMWRSTLPGDRGFRRPMANLTWAKNAVLVAAERELEYEARTANAPSKCPENRGVFGHTASPVHSLEGRTTTLAEAAE
jgi:hypothetical protein